ncbi:MAG: hypothetical protein KBT15_02830 [Bacteroidales bacterium]|nr:hypothetical protein [Candidatus Minthousia equi]
MKKSILSILLTLFSISAFAQMDEREPGLYYVYGEESFKLTPILGYREAKESSLFGIIDISEYNWKVYKGPTSDTRCLSGDFVLVIDPKRKAAVQTLSKYNVFTKDLTPERVALVPLEVKEKERIWDINANENVFKLVPKNAIPFEWQRINDNAFSIHADLKPGEYCFMIQYFKRMPYDINTILDFTVIEDF